MTKTIPSLYCPQDITWPQLLFVVLPASILSVVLVTLTLAVLAMWQFTSWVWKFFDGISIYSHRGADYHDRTRQDP